MRYYYLDYDAKYLYDYEYKNLLDKIGDAGFRIVARKVTKSDWGDKNNYNFLLESTSPIVEKDVAALVKTCESQEDGW